MIRRTVRSKLKIDTRARRCSAHDAAKHIRKHFRSKFAPDIHFMRFGRWRNVFGLVHFIYDALPKGCTGIELGSFQGESALIFSECGIGKLICVDNWDSEKYSAKRISKAEAQFDKVAAMYPKVVHKLRGATLEVMATLASTGTRVDFVYIDADHSEEAVLLDIEAARKLVKPGGLVCGHDYGRSLHPGVTVAVDKAIGKPDRTYADTSWFKRM